MKKLFLVCIFIALQVNAEQKYSDDVIAKAEAMLGKSPYEDADPNTNVILEKFTELKQNIEQKDTGEPVHCHFTVSINLDGSVQMKTKMKKVEKECEETYLNIRAIKHIELPEPKAYKAVDVIVTVSI